MIPELRVSATRVFSAEAELRSAAAGTRDCAAPDGAVGVLGSSSVESALSETVRLRAIRAGIVAEQMEAAASGVRALLVELDAADAALAAGVR